MRLNKLLLEIKNPYQGEIVMCEGLPVSDRAGHSYGCRSMQAIAARRGGLFELQAENGVFLLRLALPLNGSRVCLPWEKWHRCFCSAPVHFLRSHIPQP